MTKVNKTIFRAYDIRGIWKKDLNEDVCYLIGKAFGSVLHGMNKKTTIVGYDNRASSETIKNALIKGILESGIDVVNIGLVTTPMCYFSADLLKINSYIMITASHNPKEYNGFKFSYNGKYNAFNEDVVKLYNVIQKEEFSSGAGELIINRKIAGEYINLITSNIHLGNRPLKVVYDCGNGTTSIIAEQIFNLFDIEEIGLFDTSDGNFPNHHPDPSIEKNLSALKQKVLETHADLGVAFDGDGDRIGVVDNKGRMIDIDTLMIIIWYFIKNNVAPRKGLFDVKCTKALDEALVQYGIEPVCYRTGNSFMREKMVRENFPFGGELSGHMFFQDKWPGYDDGIYAALRLLEILSNTNTKLSVLHDRAVRYYNTRELKITVKENQKDVIIENVIDYALNHKYRISTMDGVKIVFKDGFALIRPSNTGPNITMRYEGKTKRRLEQIKKEFNNLLVSIVEKIS